ncbi:MAG: KOW domain-containing RNA-binding protein [Oscillospiraceae bacterium]|nr:KOW domain-containing RNA-binding protein [Oscillospiraceae bacterium]
MSESCNFKTGDIALALAGRDKGRVFAVIGLDAEDENYVFIANGKSRRADKPKRKKIKHLKLFREAAFELGEGDKLTNAVLRKNIENAMGNPGENLQ